MSSHLTVLSVAFDIGNKFLLLENHYSLAFQNMILSWFFSYLTGHFCLVLDLLLLTSQIIQLWCPQDIIICFFSSLGHSPWCDFISYLDFEYQRYGGASNLCIQLWIPSLTFKHIFNCFHDSHLDISNIFKTKLLNFSKLTFFLTSPSQ